MDSKSFQLSGVQTDRARRDDAIGQDERTGSQMDAGLGEPVAKDREDRAIPGGGLDDLAQEEKRRVRCGGRGGSGTLDGSRGEAQKEQGRGPRRANGAEKGERQRQVLPRRKGSCDLAGRIGESVGAFEEAGDVRRDPKGL